MFRGQSGFGVGAMLMSYTVLDEKYGLMFLQLCVAQAWLYVSSGVGPSPSVNAAVNLNSYSLYPGHTYSKIFALLLVN